MYQGFVYTNHWLNKSTILVCPNNAKNRPLLQNVYEQVISVLLIFLVIPIISVAEKSVVWRLCFFLKGGRYPNWYCDHKLHHGGLSTVWLTDLRVVSLKWLAFWNIYQQANNYKCRHLNNKHRSNFIFDEAKTTNFIFVE